MHSLEAKLILIWNRDCFQKSLIIDLLPNYTDLNGSPISSLKRWAERFEQMSSWGKSAAGLLINLGHAWIVELLIRHSNSFARVVQVSQWTIWEFNILDFGKIR